MSARSRMLAGGDAFRALTSPAVLLDSDYVIRAANPAYLRVTERSEEQLVSVNLFEAFPDNPEVNSQPVHDKVASFIKLFPSSGSCATVDPTTSASSATTCSTATSRPPTGAGTGCWSAHRSMTATTSSGSCCAWTT